jgi:hypothetical protein
MPGAVVAWTLVVAPFLLLLAYIAIYAVNGPEWDHVATAEIFYRWRDGTFDLEYLFRQHNEHRKAVPRLIILGLGLLTRWDNRPEAVLHWALMGAAAAVLFAAFRRDVAPRDSRVAALLLFVPAACLLASPRSYEALLGDGFPHYCSILGYVAALYLLIYRTGPAALAGAALCGLIATFSISNGLLIWPLGVVILLSRMRTDGLRAVPAVVWGTIGAATIALYFRGYVDPGNSSGPGYLLQEPAKALAHFLATNGSSLAPHIPSAVAVGAVIVALDVWCLVRVFDDWWRRREAPPLAAWLIVTILISVALITLNRAGFGVRQAIESRYTGLTVLAPIGIYWCMLARRQQWRVHISLRVFVTVLLLGGYVYAAGHAWRMAPAWNARKTWMAYLFYTAKYQPLSLLEKLYPNPHHARIYSAEMERMGYNVFAEPHLDPRQLSPGAPRPDFEIELLNTLPLSGSKTLTVSESDAIEIVGWAYNQAGTGPARAVFLTVDGTTDYPAHLGSYRVERGGYLRGRARRWSGFQASIGAFVLPPGEHTLSLKIVPDENHGNQAFVTEPFARILRR